MFALLDSSEACLTVLRCQIWLRGSRDDAVGANADIRMGFTSPAVVAEVVGSQEIDARLCE